MVLCLRHSARARLYLAEEILIKHPNRFQEFLIDCTSPEVTTLDDLLQDSIAISRFVEPSGEFSLVSPSILVKMFNSVRSVRLSTNFFPTVGFLPDVLSVEESILTQVIRLAKREPAESIKLPGQYFNFFTNYVSGGRYEVSVNWRSGGL